MDTFRFMDHVHFKYFEWTRSQDGNVFIIKCPRCLLMWLTTELELPLLLYIWIIILDGFHFFMYLCVVEIWRGASDTWHRREQAGIHPEDLHTEVLEKKLADLRSAVSLRKPITCFSPETKNFWEWSDGSSGSSTSTCRDCVLPSDSQHHLAEQH